MESGWKRHSKNRQSAGISRGNDRDVMSALFFAPIFTPLIYIHFCVWLWTLCRSLVVEGSVIRSWFFLSNHCTVATLAARKRNMKLEPWHALLKTRCWPPSGNPCARSAGHHRPRFPSHFPIYTAWLFGLSGTAIARLQHDDAEAKTAATWTSPRMPHTLVEIFTHAHLPDFKNRNSWAGGGQPARRSSHHVLSEPGHTQRPAAAATTGKEDSIAVRRVRHCEEVGLQEWPLAGRATVPRVLYGIGLHMSLRRRTILSKSLRVPARVALRHSHFSRGQWDRTTGRRFVQEEVRIWWQSRGLESLCLPIWITTFML